jgi:hypothetical protein
MLTGAATMADPATKAVEAAIAEECRQIQKMELSNVYETGAWNGCELSGNCLCGKQTV